MVERKVGLKAVNLAGYSVEKWAAWKGDGSAVNSEDDWAVSLVGLLECRTGRP